MIQKKTILACLGVAGALIVALWLMGLSAFVADSVSFAPPSPLQKQDAIVVLTGGTNRVDAGFSLLQKGLGKKLFISGVYRGLEVKQLLKHWKDEPQSLLDCCVVLGFEADSTSGNAIETVNWLHQEGYHSLYLVTANYHLKRALLEFNSLAPNLSIIPFPVVPEKADLNVWWQDPSTCTLVLKEYMKYIAVHIIHGFKR